MFAGGFPALPFVVQQLYDETARSSNRAQPPEKGAVELTSDAASQRLEEYVRRFLQSVGTIRQRLKTGWKNAFRRPWPRRSAPRGLTQLVSLDPQHLKSKRSWTK